MLCKTMHKVAMATALWVMALLGASLVNAQISFDDADAGTVMYSLEGLASNASLSVGDGFYAVSATGSTLQATKKLDRLTAFRLDDGTGNDNDVFVRLEGTGGLKLLADIGLRVLNNAGAGNNCFTVVNMHALSEADDGFFIYQIDPDDSNVFSGGAECTMFPDITKDINLQINLGNNTVGGISNGAPDPAITGGETTNATTAVMAGPGMLKISAYDTGPNAFRGGSAGMLLTDTVMATNTASSLMVTIDDGTAATSDVETGFTKFVGSNTDMATLGSVTVAANTAAAMHLLPNGEIAANSVGLLIGSTSMVQIASDRGFGFATFMLGSTALSPVVAEGGMLAMGATCSDPNPDDGSNAMENVCTVALSSGASTLTAMTITPKEGEDAAMIPESNFTATVMFSDSNAVMDGNLPSDVGPDAIGMIRQNGSTYQLPMVTTFEGYNNRIIIVNRSGRAARYSMTFTTEDGVTATAGSAASGMVGANQAMLLRTSEVVNLDGGNRAAITLSVVGSPSNIDVLTQIVNLNDKSTDTVRYDADQSR